ncbi:Protein of unknown function [Gryllus bimaculatus]|nr:Protein of unknown function [Gryllus bimaculatus]
MPQSASHEAASEWKRFLVMSAVAWGLPSLMTGLCAYAFERDQLLRKRGPSRPANALLGERALDSPGNVARVFSER